MNKATLEKLKRALAESESADAKVNALRTVLAEAEAANAGNADDDDKPLTRGEIKEMLRAKEAIDRNPVEARNIPLSLEDVQRVERQAHGLGISRLPVKARMSMTSKELSRAGIAGQELALVRSAQEQADRLYLVGAMLRTNPANLNAFSDYARTMNQLHGKTRAMDSYTSGEGSEWVPTQWTGMMMERVTYELVVYNLFQKLMMNTKTVSYGFQGAKPSVKYYGSYPTADSEAAIAASTPGSDDHSITAKNLLARVVFDEDLDEDGAFAIAELIQQDMVLATGEAIEDALINGDASGALDTAFTYTEHPRLAFDGLRKYVHSSNRVNGGGASFDLADMDSVRILMGGLWAANNLVWLTSFTGMIRVGQFTEVQTVDKYGPMASILMGEQMKIKGAPLLMSGFMPENLNASGVYDNVTTTTTSALAINPRGFLIGDRKMITVKAGDIIETGQRQLVSKVRLGFVRRYDATDNNVIGEVYNIT